MALVVRQPALRTAVTAPSNTWAPAVPGCSISSAVSMPAWSASKTDCWPSEGSPITAMRATLEAVAFRDAPEVEADELAGAECAIGGPRGRNRRAITERDDRAIGHRPLLCRLVRERRGRLALGHAGTQQAEHSVDALLGDVQDLLQTFDLVRAFTRRAAVNASVAATSVHPDRRWPSAATRPAGNAASSSPIRPERTPTAASAATSASAAFAAGSATTLRSRRTLSRVFRDRCSGSGRGRGRVGLHVTLGDRQRLDGRHDERRPAGRDDRVDLRGRLDGAARLQKPVT
jgi:hypothetical protein